ncbi:T-lymphocyte activation antigen CD80 isoform X2 [Cebus imitator]|uniref:T-lymphocyte activation antigen CD80 n=1 Tax=Cebus imitator TaxID=2715852 RepID=A0A2K5Q1C6_CEBIM|nr:T-lymphocyte activation antigen CD80 isoform X2 [Cebus imitator]
MGHTQRQGTPPSKGPYLMFFHLLVLFVLFHICQGIIQVTKGVKEVATLSCGHNVSVGELAQTRIYWQKEKKMVLTMMSGDMNIWPKYKNRTIFDITNNLSIVILALRPSDEGTYECVVLKYEKDAFKREHLAEVMLSVKADFPTPSITDFEIPTSSDIRRLICSTSGGFPEPHLSWLENGEELNAINTSVSQDPETELYTISSKLDFNMTTNHSFMCLIKYGHLKVNQTFNWRTPKQEHFPDTSLLSWVTTLIMLLLVIGIFVLCRLTYRFAPRCRERRRNERLRRESVRPI